MLQVLRTDKLERWTTPTRMARGVMKMSRGDMKMPRVPYMGGRSKDPLAMFRQTVAIMQAVYLPFIHSLLAHTLINHCSLEFDYRIMRTTAAVQVVPSV